MVEVERYVYQTSRGGRIYCPLEQQARIIRGATPLFASPRCQDRSRLLREDVCEDGASLT